MSDVERTGRVRLTKEEKEEEEKQKKDGSPAFISQWYRDSL